MDPEHLSISSARQPSSCSLLRQTPKPRLAYVVCTGRKPLRNLSIRGSLPLGGLTFFARLPVDACTLDEPMKIQPLRPTSARLVDEQLYSCYRSTMAEKNTPGEVEINFTIEPGYKVNAANGAWGSLTPHGELKLDFFVEALAIPSQVVHSLVQGEGLGPEIRRKPSSVFERKIQTGVLLDLEVAESIAKFMLSKIAEYRKAEKAEDDKSEHKG